MSFLGHIAPSAFAFLIGTVGAWTGLKQLSNRKALNRWPTTKGRVVERGTFESPSASVRKNTFQYCPLVRYTYQLNDKDFINDYIHPKRIQLPQHSSKKWAQKKAESFADEVTVHYNPEDPTEAFLVQTPKKILYIVIGASCGAVLYGLFLLLLK
jgi:Protein of unknown function (DUF3592)